MRIRLVAWEASDPHGTALGEITDAFDVSVRPAYNGLGEGQFSISRHSSQAAWFLPSAAPTLVRAYIDSTASDPIFAFLPDNGQDIILNHEQEQGGEEFTRGGKGALWYLADAVLFHTDYTGNDAATPDEDGNWHWTDRPVGAILVRQLEEAQARGCFPFIDWDFSRTVDSDGNAWGDTAELFKLPIGMNLWEQVEKSQSAGLIIGMDYDSLTVHAWDDHPGTDRSGSIVLQYTGDVATQQIRDSVTRSVEASSAISTALVQGDLDNGSQKFRIVNDAGMLTKIGRRKEGYARYNATPTNAILDRVGQQAIDATESQYDGPASVPVIVVTGQVPFTNYFPGDLVGVDIPGVDTAVRVAAIAFQETEAGEHDPVVELGDQVFDPISDLKERSVGVGGIDPGGTGSGGGGTTTVEVCCPPFDGAGTPGPGQPVLNEFVANGDGSTDAWTTDFPYLSGSLRVWVDGVNVSGEKAEDDPTTGDFSLSFAPASGEAVRVSYSGAA